MKILISSKYLATKLAEFDFETDTILAIRGEGSNLYLDGNKKTVEIWCDILEFNPRIKQENRRWDWVKKLVDSVDEQPITLQITENIINVIFQY